MYKKLLPLFLFFTIHFAYANDPDDIDQVKEDLQQQQIELISKIQTGKKLNYKDGLHLLQVGLWEACSDYFTKNQPKAYQIVLAKYRLLNYEFAQAEKLLATYHPKSAELLRIKNLLRIELHIQAWELAKATALCQELLALNNKDVEAAFWLGRIAIFEKSYEKAEAWATKMQVWDSANALGFGLEAEAQLWNREIELASVLLKQALVRNPYHPDFRFWYGYTIWRKRDASLLNQMAAHWELALQVHPLHYLTHWHWGNGHTNLTYADYIDSADQYASEVLKISQELLEQGKHARSMEHARQAQTQYPSSPLPLLFRASYYYNSAESNPQALDSAFCLFQELLLVKPHYGPAHNGLAAAIKKKQFQYLHKYDSLEKAIQQVEINAQWLSLFHEVFPDLKNYPTDRVEKMVWSQLYTGKAYLPMLKKLEREFVIPPLHTDLATAMKNPWFRSASTFDNRQWMDIRGVGSGATGIEYVERGSHLERNVTLHEYVHLFHYTVLTDEESRKVRQLYYEAKQEDRTLDYYAANNESEYFAQCFTAYFSSQKVHPLNHKSMNTKQDLAAKDPKMLAFLDELTAKQQAFLAGEEAALAENWAQTYVLMAEQLDDVPSAKRSKKLNKEHWYGKALSYAPHYIPAQLGLIQVWIEQGKIKKAEEKLAKLAQKHPQHAPIFLAKAAKEAWIHRHISSNNTASYLQKVIPLYQQAYQLETDLQIKATNYGLLRDVYLNQSLLDSAIQLATHYAETASEASTYLYDTKQQALGFKAWLRGKMGYKTELETLNKLLIQYPQNYQFWLWKADVLAANEQYQAVVDFLQPEAERLAKTGNPLAQAFQVQIAEAYLYLHQTPKAKALLESLTIDQQKLPKLQGLQLARIYTYLDQQTQADECLKQHQSILFYAPADQAEAEFTKGKMAQYHNELNDAASFFWMAVQLNPYHLEARRNLIRILMMTKDIKRARLVAQDLDELAYPVAPAMVSALKKLTN